MRKRGRSANYICSFTRAGVRATTTVMGPKRKNGKRTAVQPSWEVLDLRIFPTRGLGHDDAFVHSLHPTDPSLVACPPRLPALTLSGDSWPTGLTDQLVTNRASVPVRPVCECACVRVLDSYVPSVPRFCARKAARTFSSRSSRAGRQGSLGGESLAAPRIVVTCFVYLVVE